MTTQQIIIMDGPGNSELVDAFKYAYSKRHMMRVSFKLRLEIEPSSECWLQEGVQVVGLRYEAGADGMFIVTLNFPDMRMNVSAYYNANTRKGYIDLSRQPA